MSCINRIRRLFPLAGEASLDLRARVAASRFRTLSAQSAKGEVGGNHPNDQEVVTPPDEVPDPPGMFQTVGAMGAGAAGAILVAAVGVWAVFKMSIYVAGEAGRSMKPTRSSDNNEH